MDPLIRYYVHQAGRGSGDNGIEPIYNDPPFIHGHGIGSFLGELWRSCVPWYGRVPRPWVKKG